MGQAITEDAKDHAKCLTVDGSDSTESKSPSHEVSLTTVFPARSAMKERVDYSQCCQELG